MFDFFGRVICQCCKSRMILEQTASRAGINQAVFKCTNLQCYEVEAPGWKQPRNVVYVQKQVA